MILKLYSLFGLGGFLSVAAWAAALVFCASGLLGALVARRGRRLVLSAAAALAGLLLAEWTASRVAEYRLDRADEIRAAREAQQRLTVREEELRRQSGEITVRFAEDAPGDSVAGSLPSAVSPPVPAAGDEPEYRKRGKQRREQGRQDSTNAPVADRALRGSVGEEAVLSLKLPDYLLANRLSRVNRLLARLVFLGVMGMLVGDYLRRFNETFGPPFPLPIAGRWVDGVSPKSHSVLWVGAGAGDVRGLLDVVVRKGESFVYFGDRAVAGGGVFRRLRAGRYGLFPLSLVVRGEGGMKAEPEFLLDAAWFGRHVVRVAAAARPADLLAEMVRVLAERAGVRARARRTLWLVWDTGEAPPVGPTSRLPASCRETNSKFVLVTEARSPADSAVGFDEVCRFGAGQHLVEAPIPPSATWCCPREAKRRRNLWRNLASRGLPLQHPDAEAR